MSYRKASSVLPEELLKEVQKYVQGEMIYIPKTKENRLKWGTRPGTKESLAARNNQIKKDFRLGESIDSLAEQHHLSIETIKRIVYQKLQS